MKSLSYYLMSSVFSSSLLFSRLQREQHVNSRQDGTDSAFDFTRAQLAKNSVSHAD